jgi:hypothetical protein
MYIYLKDNTNIERYILSIFCYEFNNTIAKKEERKVILRENNAIHFNGNHFLKTIAI